MEPLKIRGIVQGGAGKGAFFTQVGWVLEQCRRALGYEPFPGTLNIRVVEEDLGGLDAFLVDPEFELVPEDPAFCTAQVKRVLVNSVPGAVVLPAEEVRIHGERVIEIISACNLKATLGVKDGDLVTLRAAADSRPRPSSGGGETASLVGERMEIWRDVYDFASSAGALEGYLYPRDKPDTRYLDDWIGNLVKQYFSLPEVVRARIQDSLDRTMGRAVQSLEPILGKGHRHVLTLRSLIKGDIPDSPHDFDREIAEKADRYRKEPR